MGREICPQSGGWTEKTRLREERFGGFGMETVSGRSGNGEGMTTAVQVQQCKNKVSK